MLTRARSNSQLKPVTKWAHTNAQHIHGHYARDSPRDRKYAMVFRHHKIENNALGVESSV